MKATHVFIAACAMIGVVNGVDHECDHNCPEDKVSMVIFKTDKKDKAKNTYRIACSTSIDAEGRNGENSITSQGIQELTDDGERIFRLNTFFDHGATRNGLLLINPEFSLEFIRKEPSFMKQVLYIRNSVALKKKLNQPMVHRIPNIICHYLQTGDRTDKDKNIVVDKFMMPTMPISTGLKSEKTCCFTGNYHFLLKDLGKSSPLLNDLELCFTKPPGLLLI